MQAHKPISSYLTPLLALTIATGSQASITFPSSTRPSLSIPGSGGTGSKPLRKSCWRSLSLPPGSISLVETTGTKTGMLVDIIQQNPFQIKQEEVWGECSFNIKFGKFASFEALNYNEMPLPYDVKLSYSLRNCENAGTLSRKILLTSDNGTTQEAQMTDATGTLTFKGIKGQAKVSYERTPNTYSFVRDSCAIFVENAAQLPNDETVRTWKLVAQSIQARIEDNYKTWLIAGPLANLAKRTVQELITLQNGGSDANGQTTQGKIDDIAESAFYLLLQMNLLEAVGFPADTAPGSLKPLLIETTTISIPGVNGSQKVNYTQLAKVESLPAWFKELTDYSVLERPQVVGLPQAELEAIEREVAKFNQKIAEFDAIDSVITGANTPSNASPDVLQSIEEILVKSVNEGTAFLQLIEKHSNVMKDEYNALMSQVQLASQRDN